MKKLFLFKRLSKVLPWGDNALLIYSCDGKNPKELKWLVEAIVRKIEEKFNVSYEDKVFLYNEFLSDLYVFYTDQKCKNRLIEMLKQYDLFLFERFIPVD